MSEPFIGQIMQVGFNFAPRGWATCDGHVLPISQNTALYSLLGTAFGGDGESNFKLPDLRGRSAVHVGSGPGLPAVGWGQTGGSTQFTLGVANMPAHNHLMYATKAEPDSDTPIDAYPATNEDATEEWSTERHEESGHLKSDAIENTGGGQAKAHRSPFQGIYHVIALQGLFPSQF